MKTFFECEEYTRAYTNSQIEEHKSTYCEGEIRDFIDLYIKYERENREYYTREHSENVLLSHYSNKKIHYTNEGPIR